MNSTRRRRRRRESSPRLDGRTGRDDAFVRSFVRALDDLASRAFCRRAFQSAGRRSSR